MKKTEGSIIVENFYNASFDALWRAITDHDEMILWYFDNIEAFNAEVGFKTQFLVQVEDRTFTHLWEVTEVVRGQLITYNWKYEEYPGDAFVTFELSAVGAQVKLKLELTVVEDFPDDIPEFSRNSCIQGWEYFLGQRLKEYIESQGN